MTECVQPELGHHQRALAGEVLEPMHVRGQTLRIFEVDVEADEVQEVGPEVLGGRVVHVRRERPGVLRPRRADEAMQEPLDGGRAVPAHDGCGDLVADRVAQHRGVPGACAHLRTHALLDRARAAAVVEKRDVLLPRQPDHHPQPVPLRRVQHSPRRRRVRADRVQPARAHVPEVPLHHSRGRVRLSIRARPERAVGDAADPQLLPAHEQVLATHARPRRRRDRPDRLLRRSACLELRSDDATHSPDRP